MSTVAEPAAAALPRSDRRERVGWYFYAFADHAFYTTVLAVFIGPFLTGVANIPLSAASVVYNSFLSQLVEPDRRDATSSLGWATGYVGGFLHLALCLVAVGVFGASSTTARGVMVFAGVWWAAFAVLPLL